MYLSLLTDISITEEPARISDFILWRAGEDPAAQDLTTCTRGPEDHVNLRI